MKANEVTLKRESFIFSTNERAARQHYKYYMQLGRILPTTKAQAQYFIANKCKFDVLNIVDVERIEAIFNAFGKSGEYKYTTSKSWVRLVNIEEFYEVLKLKYDIK